MARGITELRNAIRLTDKRIDEVRSELFLRETVDKLSAASWQSAWDKHPDLHERSHILWVYRADLKDELRAAERKVAAGYRVKKLAKCPTCRGSGYAKEAA